MPIVEYFEPISSIQVVKNLSINDMRELIDSNFQDWETIVSILSLTFYRLNLCLKLLLLIIEII